MPRDAWRTGTARSDKRGIPCALALALALFSVFTTEDSARVRCVKTVIGPRMTVSDRVWRLEYAGTTYVPCGPAAPRAETRGPATGRAARPRAREAAPAAPAAARPF